MTTSSRSHRPRWDVVLERVADAINLAVAVLTLLALAAVALGMVAIAAHAVLTAYWGLSRLGQFLALFLFFVVAVAVPCAAVWLWRRLSTEGHPDV
ncbi:hypothetical protein GCM10012275_38610 [Longimycelium tulufanense]|uniref:Uncharacterized protein n=1 Tax=Longimycelium tulufanense TaxID=907463 RepID=A0A8J3CGJ9_9PSEU|nr:hypothetical protein [Longimycelium tulufanense]GGM64321.1 hypothetical protein GCM10012275_38610 [Longimycelium tulufanense]